jgi:hypothetical protein
MIRFYEAERVLKAGDLKVGDQVILRKPLRGPAALGVGSSGVVDRLGDGGKAIVVKWGSGDRYTVRIDYLKLKESALSEADNLKIQKMAYDLFQYLAGKLPPPIEKKRKLHAISYYDGLAEFLEAIVNYTEGYCRSMKRDETKYKADYGSRIYEDIVHILDEAVMKGHLKLW